VPGSRNHVAHERFELALQSGGLCAAINHFVPELISEQFLYRQSKRPPIFGVNRSGDVYLIIFDAAARLIHLNLEGRVDETYISIRGKRHYPPSGRQAGKDGRLSPTPCPRHCGSASVLSQSAGHESRSMTAQGDASSTSRRNWRSFFIHIITSESNGLIRRDVLSKAHRCPGARLRERTMTVPGVKSRAWI
jgi:hypothetical protein